MRVFWTMFFLGSMLLIGIDTIERRGSASVIDGGSADDGIVASAGDAVARPTPRP